MVFDFDFVNEENAFEKNFRSLSGLIITRILTDVNIGFNVGRIQHFTDKKRANHPNQTSANHEKSDFSVQGANYFFRVFPFSARLRRIIMPDFFQNFMQLLRFHGGLYVDTMMIANQRRRQSLVRDVLPTCSAFEGRVLLP